MMAPVSTRPGLGTAVTVTRWSRAATATAAVSVLTLAVLAVLPYLAGTGITQALVTLFLLVSMAALWNLLAGYAGMISFGQQAYLGIGAYLVWLVSKTGVSPFAGIAVAAAGCAVAAVPIFAVLRPLSGGYFAVATWVVATCFFLYVTNQLWLGGGPASAWPGSCRDCRRWSARPTPTGWRWR
jgi:branched-chain amino acid transport system permease protein